MVLQFVGAGLPRTGTSSLQQALERLLGGKCLHMSEIPGHPFNLGADWDRALAGESVDWPATVSTYVATVDWPASAFWREISAVHPDAKVLLSLRDSPRTWLQSMEATVLPVARMATEPSWQDGCGLVRLLQRFAGSEWDRPGSLIDAYEQHIGAVRETVSADRLVEWRPGDGWEPICDAFGLVMPSEPFPWLNRREDW